MMIIIELIIYFFFLTCVMFTDPNAIVTPASQSEPQQKEGNATFKGKLLLST